MRAKTRVSRGRVYIPDSLRGWLVGLCASVVLMGVAGCGTNLDAVVAQTGNATAITILDILLTDFTNQVADAFDPNAPQPAGGGDDGDDEGDADDEGNGDDGEEDGGADVSPEEQAYIDGGCAVCHGDDGTSGMPIAGLSPAEMSAGLESAVHGSVSLSEDEIAAIAEFLGG